MMVSVKMLYIMQGIPGSGKSTIAQMIANATDGRIFSTDDLWYDEEGKYNFDPDLLGIKHKENQRLVTEAMVEGIESIIVDNTNIYQKDANIYIEMAEMFNYELTVIRVNTPLETALTRNAERPEDRQVPRDVIITKKRVMQDIDIRKGEDRWRPQP